ncbi:hypothetical protein KR018_007912, partial [Drosophila ironensis]
MAFQVFKFGVTTISACVGGVLASYSLDSKNSPPVVKNAALMQSMPKISLPTRPQQIKSLMEDQDFDVLIIGGGATGAGCALDSVTRGLKTALVEQDDFASGTSSRSTKLIHGGVRYLQKAILG